MSYFFSEEARLEHLEHVAYYEERQAGLGARYLAAFELAMVKICENPQRYRVEISPEIRRLRVPGFPYNILFRHDGSDVEILVVAPHRRRPGYWLGRV
ncbi:MAG: type II toxin-antitoxin system RelE/ParE family toxin [Pseudomonadota bacterium]